VGRLVVVSLEVFFRKAEDSDDWTAAGRSSSSRVGVGRMDRTASGMAFVVGPMGSMGILGALTVEPREFRWAVEVLLDVATRAFVCGSARQGRSAVHCRAQVLVVRGSLGRVHHERDLKERSVACRLESGGGGGGGGGGMRNEEE